MVIRVKSLLAVSAGLAPALYRQRWHLATGLLVLLGTAGCAGTDTSPEPIAQADPAESPAATTQVPEPTTPAPTALPDPSPVPEPSPPATPTSIPTPEPTSVPIQLQSLAPVAAAELTELTIFELRIAASLDEGGVWSTIEITSLNDGPTSRAATEITRPTAGFDREAFTALYVDSRAAVMDQPLLSLFAPDGDRAIRTPGLDEEASVDHLSPNTLMNDLIELLLDIAPHVDDELAQQFGVITRVDGVLPPFYAAQVLPEALRSDISIHTIDPELVADPVPVEMLFEDGLRSSITFVLDDFVPHLPAQLVTERLKVQFELVRMDEPSELLDVLGDGQTVQGEDIPASTLRSVDELISLIPDPLPAMRECVTATLAEGVDEAIIAVLRCDPGGLRAALAGPMRSQGLPEAAVECFESALDELDDADIENAVRAADGDDYQAGANVAELALPGCAVEVVPAPDDAPIVEEVILTLEAAGLDVSSPQWTKFGPGGQDGLQVVGFEHTDGTAVAIVSLLDTGRVLSMEFESSTDRTLSLLTRVMGTHFDLQLAPGGLPVGQSEIRAEGSSYRLCYNSDAQPASYLVFALSIEGSCPT